MIRKLINSKVSMFKKLYNQHKQIIIQLFLFIFKILVVNKHKQKIKFKSINNQMQLIMKNNKIRTPK